MGCSLPSHSENSVVTSPKISWQKAAAAPAFPIWALLVLQRSTVWVQALQAVPSLLLPWGVPCPQQLLQIRSQLGCCSWQVCFLHSQRFFLSLLGLHLSAIYRSSASGAFSWQCNSRAVHRMRYNSCEQSKWGLCIWFSQVPAPLGLLWTKGSSILNPPRSVLASILLLSPFCSPLPVSKYWNNTLSLLVLCSSVGTAG